MWHEARKQEKKIRGLMVDYKKRAERRREFYEKIKADPAQFVRAFGQACKVNLDPAIAMAAESPQSMMPWQGDTSNMIDRFDVRAHLDIMPPEKSYPIERTKSEENEERKANYERYRILVENESAGLTEEQALHQIYLDEQYGAIVKDSEEEKNKLKDKKAAIGYTYEDSSKDEKEDSEDSDDEEEEDIETLDLDIAMDVDTLNNEQMEQLNVCGTQFGMGKEDYIKYLKRDKDELEALKQAKMLEEEKAQFAGRKSRRERRMYKEKQMVGRKFSPPSYAARSSPKYEPYTKSPTRSRSRSRSKSPPRRVRKMYITSFGDGSDDDDGGGVVQGPALPPGGLNKQSENTNQKTSSTSTWDGKKNKGSIRQRLDRSFSREMSPRTQDQEYRMRSKSNEKQKSRGYRSRSRERRSRDYRSSRDRRSRSRDRWTRDERSRDERSRDRGRRSRSRDRWRDRGRRSLDRRSDERSRNRPSGSYSRRSRSNSPRSRNRKSRSHSRNRKSRSRSRDRKSRSRSRSKRSRSHSRRSRSHNGKDESTSKQGQKSRSRSRSRSRSASKDRHSSSSSKSRSRSKSRSKSKSPPPVMIKRYRRESLSSKSSDDSDNEESKKQSKATASKTSVSKPVVAYGKSSSISQGSKLTPQERLKRKMQLALNKQYKADKKAEIRRNEKMEQEKQDREEELRQRALEMRRKERERRHRQMEDEDEYSDHSNGAPTSPKHKPQGDADVDATPPWTGNDGEMRSGEQEMFGRSRSDSSSRSRSRSPRMKIVDY